MVYRRPSPGRETGIFENLVIRGMWPALQTLLCVRPKLGILGGNLRFIVPNDILWIYFSFEMIVGKFTSIRSSGQNGKTISRTEQLLNNTPLATRGNTSGKRGGRGMGDLYPWVEKSAMKVKYSCPGHIMSPSPGASVEASFGFEFILIFFFRLIQFRFVLFRFILFRFDLFSSSMVSFFFALVMVWH